MLPGDVKDLQLIKLVKTKQDSEAIQLLAARHTGLYVSIVQQYTYVPHFERQELLADKLTNIYQYAIDFDPNRGAEFSTYLGHRIKWECKSLVNKYPEPLEMTEQSEPLYEAAPSVEEGRGVKDYVYQLAADTGPDPRFPKIFKLRHLGGTKTMSWKKVGAKMGLSHEACRIIYRQHIESLKRKVVKDHIV